MLWCLSIYFYLNLQSESPPPNLLEWNMIVCSFPTTVILEGKEETLSRTWLLKMPARYCSLFLSLYIVQYRINLFLLPFVFFSPNVNRDVHGLLVETLSTSWDIARTVQVSTQVVEVNEDLKMWHVMALFGRYVIMKMSKKNLK